MTGSRRGLVCILHHDIDNLFAVYFLYPVRHSRGHPDEVASCDVPFFSTRDCGAASLSRRFWHSIQYGSTGHKNASAIDYVPHVSLILMNLRLAWRGAAKKNSRMCRRALNQIDLGLADGVRGS